MKSPFISNFVVCDLGTKDKPEKVDIAVPPDEIAKAIFKHTSGIMSLNGQPFVVIEHNGEKRVEYIKSGTELNAWVAQQCDVSWTSRPVLDPHRPEYRVNPTSWAAMFAHLKNSAPQYTSLSILPHYPPRPGTFYVNNLDDYDTANADGSVLDEYVSLFNGDSELDQELIKSLIATPFWGGHPGTTPMFVVSSDHGVGVGKSSTIEAVGSICGGTITTDDGDSSYELAVSLSDHPHRRLLLIDNVKGKQDSEKWESLITSAEVKIRVLHKGTVMVPNTWIWTMTANLCDLSTDLASRSVVIKIGRRNHDRDFKTEVADFLATNRRRLVADILAHLMSKSSCEISKYTRWQAWERAVLEKSPMGDEMSRMVQQRRIAADSDADDAMQIRDAFENLLARAGWDPAKHNVVVPVDLLVEEIRKILLRTNLTTKSMWMHLEPLLRTDPLNHCSKGRHRFDGARVSGLLWAPNPGGEVYLLSSKPPKGGRGNIVDFPPRGAQNE